MASHIEELRRLKSEGKISNGDFNNNIEENKKKLDELIAKSPVTVETKQIIRASALALYGSLPKIPKRKPKDKNKEEKTRVTK